MAAPAERAYQGGNEYWYEFDNTSTWLAEVLDGSMRTSFEFTHRGGELYGRDGTSLGEVFRDSIDDAERIVAENPNLLFELRRRHIEQAEYEDMLTMVRGERPNTMIVVSDFPPELMDAVQDIGGYNVSRKQTMLRVITLGQDGRLHMTSQSLDLSDRAALEAIYTQYGIVPASGELLGQRIFTTTKTQEQPYVVDRLTGVYDRALAAQYGGSWYAGRKDEDKRNTYEFVRQQVDLIDYFVRKRLYSPHDAENERYGLAAAMVERYKQRSVGQVAVEGYVEQTTRHMGAVSLSSIELEMLQAGNRARMEGRDFSACGTTVKSGFQLETFGQLQEAGYGNKTTPETKYKFDKKAFCVVCQRPPKEDDKPKMCGPCSICQSCDKALKKSSKS